MTVLRSILDRLIYDSSYETIDTNLTDGNVGARKRRGCRDNIFVISAVTNSVLRGKSEPIQVQVTDAEKCFDKLWLQSSINSLHDAGLQNDMLNLLYIENRNAQIAIKVNNKLSRRINVTNVVMQGLVWGSLKCTSIMDKLNKHVMLNERLQYFYKDDKEIPIGVRGMVDDTLGISKCGTTAIALNSVINSFMESERLTLSKEKSVVVHIGKKHRCSAPCPKLKVHNAIMTEETSAKYLGNFVSSNGGVKDTVEDRRNKGWGKVATIKGILDQVDMGGHRVEVGLLLRRAILVNSLLFTAETWSGIREADLVRLEQVDFALLNSLVSGHSKCPREFPYLETGTLKLRHILTMNQMMYHHHLIQTEAKETIRKIYEKQKMDKTKGDWFQLLLKDFEFVGEELNKENIKSMSKSDYKKKVKKLVEVAAFKFLLKEKAKHSKLEDVKYNKFKIQNYLVDKRLNNEERNLLYSLRSRCFPVKLNLKKMHKNDLKCRFQCNSDEDQKHLVTMCDPVLSQLTTRYVNYDDIFESVTQQKEVVSVFLEITKLRTKMIDKLLPGEDDIARTRAHPV